jgi:hypothetical protein
MSPGFSRQRAINGDGRVNELFQGPTRLASGGYSYPGDAAFRDNDRVTIQIHSLELRQAGIAVAQHVPVIAVWLPRRLATNWIAQHQPN